jgi:tRNA A-37 threonylcarbamoyl transferase component Bud32
MSKKRYPRQLSQGHNNPVIALSDAEVAKLFSEDTRSDIGSEAEKLRYANAINHLLVKFIRLDFDEEKQWQMLVMERLYPLDYRTAEIEKRELWLDVFEDGLKALHAAGFVHHDLARPSNIEGDRYDNIFLTHEGLRLIDAGVSAIRDKVGDNIFTRMVEKELQELELFKTYFLNR